MLSADPIPFRGSVLLAAFVDSRAGEIANTPVLYNERQKFTQLVNTLNGQNLSASVRTHVAVFPQAANALTAAQQIVHNVVYWRNSDPNRRGLSCRLLLGYGQATLEGDRLRSDWTHRLPGLVSHVPEYGIAALPEFMAQIKPEAPTRHLQVPNGPTLQLLPTGSETNDAMAQTRHAPSLQSADSGVFTELTVTVGGLLRVVKASECPVQVGRDKTCGVILDGDLVSRVHGVLLYEQGKFHYLDDSRNGSFVLTASGEEVSLKKGERLALIGQGAVSPGTPLATQRGQILRFSSATTRLSMAGHEGDTRILNR